MRQVRILPNDWSVFGDSGEGISVTVGEDRGRLPPSILGQLKPNNDGCSGTATRTRRRFADKNCGRCPKTTRGA